MKEIDFSFQQYCVRRFFPPTLNNSKQEKEIQGTVALAAYRRTYQFNTVMIHKFL